MAKNLSTSLIRPAKKKRKGVHSKNTSKNKRKKPSRGQG
tara:strand:- start:327 stop:443 length:117 start_codon:yes stop_codon:yes gene_type:complete